MPELMTLLELKELLGLDPSDTSQDAILQLYLDSALEQAFLYCNLFDWETEPLVLPSSITLGIVRYVQIMRDVYSRSVGVSAESIGGMSKSYNNVSNKALYTDVWDLWKDYHRQASIFRAARYAHMQGGDL